jgi:UDPglucose 6-dehydrogenase
VLGLTFKPNTDDMREAPSLALITALEDAGARVRGYDPEGTEQAAQMLPNMTACDSAYGCIESADALVIVTEWNEFRALDMRRVRSLLKAPVVVDLRNIYRAEDMARLGFAYHSIGRPSATNI